MPLETAEYIVVFVTTASIQEADQIAKALLEKHLVACANIVQDIHSIFWWNNSLDTAQEVLLLMKSKALLFPAIITTVKSLHNYEVPEIIALPIIAGSKEYLQWLDRETQDPDV